MATLKNKGLKKSLVQKAEENATVTQGTRGEQRTLKQGVPSEHSRKHLDGKIPVVGVSIGTTLNMDNYESLRADVWLTDEVHEGESVQKAYERVTQIVSTVLQEVCSQYRE